MPLMISFPYRIEPTETGYIMYIKTLKMEIEAESIKELHELARANLAKLISNKINKDNVQFQEDHLNKNKGLLISSFWPELLEKAFEYEPLVENKDNKSSRQKRIDSQEYLNAVK